jgi:signal transduction histidine kinase
VIAAVLFALALTELLLSDEQPDPTLLRCVEALLPPVLVAFSRIAPVPCAGIAVGLLLVSSLEESPAGVLGAGFAWLALAFALSAWTRSPWPWLLAMLLAQTIRDTQTSGWDLTDVAIDWAFLLFTVGIGRAVFRRAAQAADLSDQLRAADAEREERTRDAVARERALIARELHDIVAHAVSLIVVQAGTARPHARQVDAELAEVLETIERCGREALTELRRLLGVLRAHDDSALEPVPDLARIHELVHRAQRTGLVVEDELHLPDEVPAGVALCAYRAVQEGLTNALRHAAGSPVVVAVGAANGTLEVRVQDQGGTARSDQLGAGTGLVGLRERVATCGGELHAGPSGAGFLLEVRLPLAERGPRIRGAS